MGGGGKVARRMCLFTMELIFQKNGPLFVKKCKKSVLLVGKG